MDIFLGFGKVLRVRMLRQGTHRRSLIRNVHVETVSERKVKHDYALALLERRRMMKLEGLEVKDLEKSIHDLGFMFEDEPSRTDGAYSYWAKR